MKPNWKDTSSWSQSDKDRSTPTEWTLTAEPLAIVVHHYIGCGDDWFVSCHQIRMERRDLGTDDASAAKEAALVMVRGRVEAMAAALERIEGD